MSRGNNPNHPNARVPSTTPAQADVPTAETVEVPVRVTTSTVDPHMDMPAAPPPAPTKAAPEPAADAKPVRFYVSHGTVSHDGKIYVVGDHIPVSEAHAMLMPWAIERR